MKILSFFLNRYFIALTICIFSFMHFIFIINPEPLLPSPTAFEWPAVDMMVYFERALDPHFLLNDFFTNSSHEPSPRQLFAFVIIFFTKLLNTNYYTVFFALKAGIKIFLPAIFYLFLCAIPLGFTNELKNKIKDIVLAPWAFLAGTWWVAETFTVANWRPLPLWAAPQSLGLLLAFLSFILWMRKGHKPLPGTGVLSIFFLFAATLIHPAMAIFTATFIIISSLSIKDASFKIFISFIAIGSATWILQHFFADPYKANNLNFIQNYVIEPYIHRGHYAPESFGAYGKWPWYVVAKYISYCFIITFFAALLLRQYRITLLSGLYLTTYWIAIELQIFFINDIPSRTMAILGPIRFTQFGYAMMAIVISGIMAELFYKIFNNTVLTSYSYTQKLHLIFFISFILTGFSLTLFSLYWLDNPKKLLYDQHQMMYQWIATHTDPSDTFAVPLSQSELFISIPILAKRPIYYANAMAFSDKFLEENTLRKNFIFGSYKEWREGGPGGFYCHLLTTKRLQMAAKKFSLNWVIMPNECLDKRFSGLKVAFQDKTLSILSLRNISH